MIEYIGFGVGKKKIEFGKVNLIYGDNKCGKTAMLEIIDYMLGSSTSDRIKIDNQFDTGVYEMKVNGKYLKINKNKSERYFDGVSSNETDYTSKVMKLLFEKPINVFTEEGEKNINPRQFMCFNIFHENNVGPSSIMLSKLREIQYIKDLVPIYSYIFDVSDNSSEIKEKISNSWQELKELEIKQNEYEKNANKTERAERFLKDSDNTTVEEMIKVNHEIKILKQQIDMIKNQELYSNPQVDKFLKILLDEDISEEDKNLINEKLKSNKEKKLSYEKIKSRLNELSDIASIYKYVPDDYVVHKAVLISTENYIDRTSDIENLKNEIKSLRLNLRDLKLRISDAMGNQISGIMLEYLEILNDGFLGPYEKIDADFDYVDFSMSNIFDPVLLSIPQSHNRSKKTMMSKNAVVADKVLAEKNLNKSDKKEMIKQIGSHSFRMFLQLAYILSIHEYVNKTTNRVAKFLILDHFTQPLDEKNTRLLLDFLDRFLAKKQNKDTQIFILDTKDISGKTNIFDRKIDISLGLIQENQVKLNDEN